MARTGRKRGPRKPPAWEAKFLAALSDTGNILYSCRIAEVGRQTVYDAKNRDEAFAELWDDALDEAADAMEIEARRRAVQGIKKTVYVRSGTDPKTKIPVYEKQDVRLYSDNLLMFMLKGARPEKYRDGFDFKAALAVLAASAAGGEPGAEGDPGGERPARGRRGRGTGEGRAGG